VCLNITYTKQLLETYFQTRFQHLIKIDRLANVFRRRVYNCLFASRIRVARFFSVHYTKSGKNIPNDHKIYQMAIKTTKWPYSIRNSHKICEQFLLQGPPKCTQIWFLGMKIFHLANLWRNSSGLWVAVKLPLNLICCNFAPADLPFHLSLHFHFLSWPHYSKLISRFSFLHKLGAIKLGRTVVLPRLAFQWSVFKTRIRT
jgi:hypothetical protein